MTNLEKYKGKILIKYANDMRLACAIARCRGVDCHSSTYTCQRCVSQSLDWLLEEAPIAYWSKVKQGAPVYLLENDELVGYFVAQYGGSVVVDVDKFNDKYVYDSWGANVVYAGEK